MYMRVFAVLGIHELAVVVVHEEWFLWFISSIAVDMTVCRFVYGLKGRKGAMTTGQEWKMNHLFVSQLLN